MYSMNERMRSSVQIVCTPVRPQILWQLPMCVPLILVGGFCSQHCKIVNDLRRFDQLQDQLIMLIMTLFFFSPRNQFACRNPQFVANLKEIEIYDYWYCIRCVHCFVRYQAGGIDTCILRLCSLPLNLYHSVQLKHQENMALVPCLPCYI